jgi:hypothetical protein
MRSNPGEVVVKIENRRRRLALARGVIVERAVRDSGECSNLVDPDPAEPRLVEDLTGRIDDAAPGPSCGLDPAGLGKDNDGRDECILTSEFTFGSSCIMVSK